MAQTFTGSLKVAVTGTLTNSSDLGTDTSVINYSKSYGITNGTAADNANMIWSDTRTLNASTAEDLDLAGGLTNAFGTTVTFTKITGIIISAAAANTNLVLVGGDANGFVNWVASATDIIKVRPGGTFALYSNDATGYAVTGGTGDVLQIENSSSGTSVTYDIILIGCV